MTPLELEILLHYHSRADDYRGGDFSAPAVVDAIRWFVAKRLLIISPVDGIRYARTARGVAHVEALRALPLPVETWVTPSTGMTLDEVRSATLNRVQVDADYEKALRRAIRIGRGLTPQEQADLFAWVDELKHAATAKRQ